jgi:hypothetical protein
MAEQPAKVIEMFLVSGGFLALIARPFLFEFGGGHGSVANSASFSRPDMGGFYRKTGISARMVRPHGTPFGESGTPGRKLALQFMENFP